MNNKTFSLIKQEEARQRSTINLIASENYTSPAVLHATSSVLTNKYAEGYPGKRYYSGCEIIDQVENHAKTLGTQLFGSEHINVQPHAGSQANMAVYLSSLKPGDTILGMSLGSGGHLTHGHPINFSGTLFNFVHYNVNRETEHIDYDELAHLAAKHRPKMIVAGASAYSRIIDFERIAAIAQNIDALFFADIAHIAGLVIAGLHPSPIAVADFVTSTTHKTLRGPRGGLICSKKVHAAKIDKSVMPGMQGGPLMHSIAAKAVAFEEALTPEFYEYQRRVVANAQAMCEEFKQLGYHIVAGGTDNHLFLINLKKTTQAGLGALAGQHITGVVAEKALERAGITVNRNAVPYDEEKPLITSGIRIGTPAITTRGFQKQDAIAVVHWIHEALINRDDEAFLNRLRAKITAFSNQFPLHQTAQTHMTHSKNDTTSISY